MRAPRHRFAFAKHAVIPLLLGYELGAVTPGILSAALFCAIAYYRHVPLWKVLGGFWIVLSSKW
jgi:hypothetical protein